MTHAVILRIQLDTSVDGLHCTDLAQNSVNLHAYGEYRFNKNSAYIR